MINRGRPTKPAFGDALRRGVAAGVEAYAYNCRVTEKEVTLWRSLPLRLQ